MISPIFTTQVVGNGALVSTRIVSTGYCQLRSVFGYNNSTACYIQIHQSATVPADQAVPLIAYAAPANSNHYLIPGGAVAVDLSACTIVCSSTLATYTAIGGTTVTIQALIALTP